MITNCAGPISEVYSDWCARGRLHQVTFHAAFVSESLWEHICPSPGWLRAVTQKNGARIPDFHGGILDRINRFD